MNFEPDTYIRRSRNTHAPTYNIPIARHSSSESSTPEMPNDNATEAHDDDFDGNTTSTTILPGLHRPGPVHPRVFDRPTINPYAPVFVPLPYPSVIGSSAVENDEEAPIKNVDEAANENGEEVAIENGNEAEINFNKQAKVESTIQQDSEADPNNMDTPNELSRDKTNYELLQQMKSYTSPEVKIVHESYEKKMERWKRMGDDEFCYVNGNLVPNYVNEARAGS